MGIKFALMFALALPLAACTTTSATPKGPPPAPYALSPEETKGFEDAARAALKDPNSAMFNGVVASKAPDGTIYACGRVNAKNSFGGYTGQQWYFGVKMPAANYAVLGFGGTDAKDYAVLTMCKKHGLGLT